MKNFRIFNLLGEVSLNTEIEFSEFINEVITDPELPVIITINSPGGSAEIGFSIYNKIRALPNPVYTLITGSCYSIAEIIFLAVPFERRFAFNYTSFFTHSSRTKILDYYTPHELSEECKDTNKINCDIYGILCNNTNISTSLLNEIFFEKNYEAVKYFSDDFEKLGIARIITKFSDIFNSEYKEE